MFWVLPLNTEFAFWSDVESGSTPEFGREYSASKKKCSIFFYGNRSEFASFAFKWKWNSLEDDVILFLSNTLIFCCRFWGFVHFLNAIFASEKKINTLKTLSPISSNKAYVIHSAVFRHLVFLQVLQFSLQSTTYIFLNPFFC